MVLCVFWVKKGSLDQCFLSTFESGGGGGGSPDFGAPAAFGGRFKHEMLKLPYNTLGGGELFFRSDLGGQSPPFPPR